MNSCFKINVRWWMSLCFFLAMGWNPLWAGVSEIATTQSRHGGRKVGDPLALSAQSNYVRGLRLYEKRGEEAKSYPFFEAVFSDPRATFEQKLFSSLVLAYASPAMLNQKKTYAFKKQDYARFYLKNQSGLTPKVIMDLHRVIGDACFHQRLFDEARREYQILADDTSQIRNQAYGEYSLGWVELNQEVPLKAFHRWKKFLTEKGPSLLVEDSGLYRAMAKDLGRAWVEAIEVGGVAFFGQLAQVLQLPGFESYLPDFSEGLVIGMKRVGRQEVLAHIREELIHSPELGQTVFEGLIQRGFVFKLYPCLLAGWTKAFPKAVLPPRESLIFSNACAKKIIEKKECGSPQAKEFREFFEGMTFEHLEAGLETGSTQSSLLPRVSFSVGCGHWGSACRDFLQMGIHQATALSKRMEEAQFKPLTEACGNAFYEPGKKETPRPESKTHQKKNHPSGKSEVADLQKKEPVRPLAEALSSEFKTQLKKQVAELAHLWSAKKLLQADKKDPFYPLLAFFLKDTEFRELWSQKVLQGATDFQGYPLVLELLLEHFTDAETLAMGERLLGLYASSPLSELWFQVIQALVQKKMDDHQFGELRQFLAQFVPLQPSLPGDMEKSQLWEFLWLGLPADSPEKEMAAADFQMWWRFVFEDPGLVAKWPQDRKMRLFALAMSFHQELAIWEHWPVFSGVVQTQPAMKKVFFQLSLEALQQGKLEKSKITSFVEGRLLLQLAEADFNVKPQEVRKLLGLEHALFGELDTFEKLKALSQKNKKTGLHLNAYLVSNIGVKIKNLNAQQQLVLATPWSSPAVLLKAFQLFEETIQDFIAQVEKVRKNLVKHPELGELDGNLVEILQQLQDQREQVKKQVMERPQAVNLLLGEVPSSNEAARAVPQQAEGLLPKADVAAEKPVKLLVEQKEHSGKDSIKDPQVEGDSTEKDRSKEISESPSQKKTSRKTHKK